MMSPSTRLRALAVLLALAPACRGEQPPPLPTEGTAPIHVRIAWTEDPAHVAVVSWSTPKPAERNTVHFDRETRGGDSKAYARHLDADRNGAYARQPVGDPELFYHHARLTDLTPDTTYWFVVESDGEVSRELHFRTAPAEDRPVTILAGSDSRSDRDQRRLMNRRIATLAGEDPEILAFAHGGDYVWAGFRLAEFADWLTDHELTTTEDGRVLPIVPTRGNHESEGELFDDVFRSPGGGLGRNWFALRLSPEVLLITLNTEVAGGGDQAEFLERTLADADDVRWKMAQYHRALWPAVKKDASAKPHWVPLFERYDLDLAHESDGHALKRTVPIRDGERAEDGVVYIGEGGLGVKQRTPRADRWFLQEPGFATSAHHVWRLRFGLEDLELTAIAEDGEVLDHLVLPARERVR